jgi:glutamine cyclotransferase
MKRALPVLAMAFLAFACSTPAAPAGAPTAPPAAVWRAEVVATLPHDPASFTQGLEWHDGEFFESSGLTGSSFVQLADPATGAVQKRTALPSDWFAEGLTLADPGLWLITWQNNIASLRDPQTLEEIRQARYEGEGWGLCHDETGSRLIMSNGSSTLTFRDPSTFAALGSIEVRTDTGPIENLNELECADGSVWANVWYKDSLYKIDPLTGLATAVVHIGALPGLPDNPANRPGVLNGIAAVPGEPDHLYITGKNWPHIYKIRLTP